MNDKFDVNTDYYLETPIGKDPDACSISLNTHHRILWSKRLPNGEIFDLKSIKSGYGKHLLYHKSHLGEFTLSSDAIVHQFFFHQHNDRNQFKDRISYSKRFPCLEIKNKIPEVITDFWKNEIGITSYLVFPALQINRKRTINQERGISSKICDRIDLTIECIRRYYENKNEFNPLYEVLDRYKDFFALFQSFKDYVDYFLLQDLVDDSYQSVKFVLPFDHFVRSPLPQSVDEYIQYKKNMCDFIDKRRLRISSSL